jgi:glutathione synthase/RimK-type ligase-like ATP-grasp enzyme
MILVCGRIADPVTCFFCTRLDQLRTDYRLLDLSSYPTAYQIVYYRECNKVFGTISGPGWSLLIGDLTGVFVRNLEPDNSTSASSETRAQRVALEAEKDLGLDSIWAALDCPVANPPSSLWSNHSKPYQTLFIRGGQLQIPKTLITSDEAEAERFYEAANGRVIYKSMGARSRGTHRFSLNKMSELVSAGNAPLQLQEEVPGVDIRLHVVRDRVFATKVYCRETDYRLADSKSLRLETTTVPASIAAECIRITNEFGLLLSGIDLRETPDGRYFFFEVNTAPGFAFYEERTGQQISAALSDVLTDR